MSNSGRLKTKHLQYQPGLACALVSVVRPTESGLHVHILYPAVSASKEKNITLRTRVIARTLLYISYEVGTPQQAFTLNFSD